MRPLLLSALSISLGLCLSACGGDQHWTVDSNWKGNEPLAKQGSENTFSDGDANTLSPVTPVGDNPDPLTWVGVRLDLSMKPSAPRAVTCGCLAIEVGMPGKQAFLWDGKTPPIGPDALAVAVSTRGVECAAVPDESKRRASISAVDSEGDDVFIEIEDLPEGQPLALGAIIRKPGPNGALYIRPRSKKVGYVPQGEDKRCKIKTATQAPKATSGTEAP